MSQRKRVGHYVSSAHWDREWYECFQDYRFRLVSMLDELLDTMSQCAEFRYFQSDGQSIMWEDYLAIRPERASQIRQLAGEGRLRIGPWYGLPDEFLVSGESLIRNLQRGIRVASQFGRPSRVGFVSDIFGHISQLPQILRGFHIDNAFLWRGVNESTHGAMFRWRSPDGSEVLTYRFSPIYGYGLYAEKVRTISKPDEPVTMETALAGLREVIDIETERCPTDSFLVFDGADHMEVEPLTIPLREAINANSKDVELIHSHLEGFVEDMREQKDRITRVFEGELREPGQVGDDGWLIAGVLSSRIHLKQANAACESELCQWAEPFGSFAADMGVAYPASFLDLAWKYLLQNHPHDSICACSLDRIDRDMAYRFEQAHSIAAHVSRDAMRAIASRVVLPELGEKDLNLTVFNASAIPIDGPVDLTLSFPGNCETTYQEFFGYEKKIGFRLYDADNEELPYQYVNQRSECPGFTRKRRKLPYGHTRHEVDVTVRLKVPAFGYTQVICRPVAEPTRYLGSMLANDHTIENKALTVTAGSNGTITITDKSSGVSYERLLTLEDVADIADGWHRGMAVNDAFYSSAAASADVAVTADGIGKATLRIRVTLQLPESFAFDRMVRSEQLKPLVVTHHVTLRTGARFVEVRTEVENSIRDHRLRVLMPTGAEAETYLADSVFDVVERPIALRADNARYKELELETKPQQTWTAVYGEGRGLAVVSTGLPESAVRDQGERPIALTLLRSFAKTPSTGTGNEMGGQIQGHHSFRYLLVPLAESPDVGYLCRLGQLHAAGLRVIQMEARERCDPCVEPVERTLSGTDRFLSIDSADVVLTALHRCPAPDDKVVFLRLFNPTTTPYAAKVTWHGRLAGAAIADLEGKTKESLEVVDSGIDLTFGPKQIMTVRLETT